MATIKTVEYRCPHCNKKLSSTPRNDYFAIKGKLYGEPFETCKKCKKIYEAPFTIEPASKITLQDKVPFWITSVRFMVALIILAVCTFGVGLIVLIPAYLLTCAFSRNYRQQHKDRLLTHSRERLKDPEYFVRYLISSVYLPDKSVLTPQALAVIHARAQAEMDADRPLDIAKITHEIVG